MTPHDRLKRRPYRLALTCVSLLSMTGCFLKPAFQVDPCLVPHNSSKGARQGFLRHFYGTPWVEPVIEDNLKQEYGGDCKVPVQVPRRVVGVFGFETLENRCTFPRACTEGGPTPCIGKAERNSMIEEVLTRCDLICANHKSGFVAQSVLQSLAFGMAGVGLSAAGSVVSGGASQAVSAASTGTQGAGSEVSKDVYNEKVGAAIANAIDADQKTNKTNIRTREKEDLDTYPVYAGLDDVEEYHESCSFSSGLELVQKDVGTAKDAANKKYEAQIVSAKFKTDAATDLLRQFWKPDGTNANAANAAQLRSWMRDHNMENLSITLFLNGDVFADARAKAASDLKLR